MVGMGMGLGVKYVYTQFVTGEAHVDQWGIHSN